MWFCGIVFFVGSRGSRLAGGGGVSVGTAAAGLSARTKTEGPRDTSFEGRAAW
jgi:hypothetical protein